MKDKKVAVVGEVKGKGGAERVMLEIVKEFQADIFPIPYKKSFPEFENFEIFTVPLLSERFSIKPRIFDVVFSNLEGKIKNFALNLSKYDIVFIGKAKGVFTGIKNHPNIYYCHGPPSYIFQHRKTYAEKYGKPFIFWSNFQKKIWDMALDHIDKWLTNSEATRKVLEKLWNVEAKVVHPPVCTEKFKNGESRDYFISVQTLSVGKRVDWQVKAFNGLNEKLVIVGTGPEKEKLEKQADENIKFKGNVNDEELIDLYSHCKAVIQTNPWEDFGITPVEGMASGKPAICPNRAGFTETITKETGILFDKPFVKNLRKSIIEFDEDNYDKEACQRRADNFNEKKFRREIRKEVDNGFG